jgi:hypothetical protein
MKATFNNISSRNKNANQEKEANEDQEHTVNTGVVTRNHVHDAKTTIRKRSFESKPIMKELGKRIQSYSKQYTPEYFTQIL